VGAVPEPVQAIRLIAPAPLVEHLTADAALAAGQRHVAGDLLSVAQDRQASLGHPGAAAARSRGLLCGWRPGVSTIPVSSI
jgi:hypothetical protein